ncbi:MULTISPECIES: YiaA/YiaB family inner membrane protein [Antrihabitans]|jgi:hypothetical protein|uniref:YiaAB two helix domain-containing protein n=2 Tax=Antrihabitans TaxID=2799491 RepID=A0A934NRZ6_9NOCA|nr:YiaA/YiaB family inner membrane protein [Antrihabitans stalagmiti]MBJ8340393.1 hypothetical protein [Antrihabitans stalagmiti]
MTTPTAKSRNTTAFYIQAVVAFGVSLFGTLVGVYYLPIDPWQKGFLIMTALFLVTSCFTLAKVVRDQQEEAMLREARMERLITEHDAPFKMSKN